MDPVRLARHDEGELDRAPLRALADGVEQPGSRRRLVGDDEDVGRL